MSWYIFGEISYILYPYVPFRLRWNEGEKNNFNIDSIWSNVYFRSFFCILWLLPNLRGHENSLPFTFFALSFSFLPFFHVINNLLLVPVFYWYTTFLYLAIIFFHSWLLLCHCIFFVVVLDWWNGKKDADVW